MSRIVVFDLDNLSVGEFTAPLSRGYAVLGSASTNGGGSTSFIASKALLEKGWLMPGRMVLVEDDRLEPWAGVIDMPIGLLPGSAVSVYNAEYLLSLRTPDRGMKLTGKVAKIVGDMIALANQQEEMYLRMGEQGGSETYREEKLDQRQFWDQLAAIVKRSRSEMVIRPKREPSDANRLYLYVDIFDQAGETTDFLLHDGQDGNVTVRAATMDRQVWNRVIGINGSASEAERLTTQPYSDEDSINAFRLRSRVENFRSTVEQATLNKQAQVYLATYGMPVIRFDVMIKDKGETFANIRKGNSVILHAARVTMPDGRKGWRGTCRVMAYAYNEGNNTIGATLEATYEFV